MPATASMLARLRRSVLGAWLASAYALAVLAAALAPAPAMAHPALDGMVLCSGEPAPEQNAPASPADQAHCQGCPANPVFATPPDALQPADARVAVYAPLQPLVAGLRRGVSPGLPQSRGPPAPALA